MRRYAHAASHITGPVFVMSGGHRDDGFTLSDIWLCDTTSRWIKVPCNWYFSTAKYFVYKISFRLDLIIFSNGLGLSKIKSYQNFNFVY